MYDNTRLNTPKHCHNCWKLTECKQAVNMNANTEPVDGYAWDADHWCIDCLPKDADNTEPLDNDESDSPCHCNGCGVPLDCQLTEEGVAYVREALRDGGGCCQELWPVLFTDYLDTE